MKYIAISLLVILLNIAIIHVAVSLVWQYINMKRAGTSYKGQSAVVYGYCLVVGIQAINSITLLCELL